MSDAVDVLRRMVLDAAFRARVLDDPETSLAGYALTAEERHGLATPGPHWLRWVAQGLAVDEVPVGPAWSGDPEAADAPSPADASSPAVPPSAADASSAADAPGGVDAPVVEQTPSAGTAAPAPASPSSASPFTGLPAAALDLHLAPGTLPDGRPGWSATLAPAAEAHPDGVPARVRLHLEVVHGRPTVRVGPASAGVPATDRPQRARGPRFGHRPDTDAARRQARRTLDRGASLEDLAAYLGVVAGRLSGPDTGDRAPVPARPGGPHITVVGLGLTGVDHLTREAEAAIRCAREVLYVDTGLATGAFLEARCPRVTPLFAAHYRSGSARLGTYEAIGARVLAAALDHAPVVLAVPGHPTVFSYTPLLLRDAAPGLGLQVRIQPGISAEDAILALLGLDPGDHGIQAFEATDVLLRGRPVAPDVLTLLWQVGTLETRLHTDRVSRPERLHRLVAWLRRTFPADHPVIAVHVPILPGMAPALLEVPLGDLADQAAALHPATTLVVPPRGRRHLMDTALARLIDDPGHLWRITRPRGSEPADAAADPEEGS